MNIVLDSNVYIAAFATRGLCAELFEYCLKNCDIFSCDEILSEVQNKLLTKIKLPEDVVTETVHFIKEQTTSLIPKDVRADLCRDPKDTMVLGLALASSAEFVITGDQDLLVLKTIGETKIVNPRGFWLKLKKEG